MDQKLQEVLIANRAEGVFHSHVSMVQPRGRFQFNKQKLGEFWDTYMKILDSNPDMISGIAEKPQKYLPVLVDVDIKIECKSSTDKDRLYTKEDMIKIIGIYQSVLRNVISSCTDESLICLFLDKKPYWIDSNEKSFMKHGFHLHFPNCLLSRIDQEIHVIPRVKTMMNEMKLFSGIDYKDSGDVIDKACCSNAWLLYGSRKDENKEPYRFSSVWNSSLEEITLAEAFKSFTLHDYKDRVIPFKGKERYYLPRLLSIIPGYRDISEVRSDVSFPLSARKKVRDPELDYSYSQISMDENLRVAKRLLPMLASWRYEDHSEWMDVGWILYNVGRGCQEALEMWCDWSSQSEDKYDEAQCIYHWDKMVVKDKTMGTLRFYARMDSSSEYSKFKTEESDTHVQDSLNGSHYNIAKIMQTEYRDEFVCASISNKLWFQFRDHHWEQIEEGIFLRKKISTEVASKFAFQGCEMFNKLNTVQAGSADATSYNARLKQAHKMANNLNSHNYKNAVMKECCEVFYDRRFKEKLDTNPNLICFKNGVYDLNLCKFRAGRPEDFISKTLPINYTNFNEHDEKVKDIKLFLEQVFPDKSIREYFMKTSSEVFTGGNHRKIVVFWTGEGDNGKSVTQSFFEKMLGPLAIKFNTTVVTGKKVSNGAANAELARAGGGVRWAVLEEPDGDEMINVGIMKNMSGNDSIFARDLFEKGKDTREITPMFKLCFICNKLPKLKHADKATWNRIRVLPFESTFCRPDDPAPPTYEEQLRQKRFPMDPNFSRKIPGLLEAFAWVLLKYRTKNIPYKEPEKVLAATEMYKKQNDIYRQFIEECICKDPTKSLSIVELYSQFKDWFRDSLPHHSIPVKNDIAEYFSKIWGEPQKGKKWKGWKVRTLEDQIQDGTAIVMDDDDLVDYDDVKSYLPDM